MLTTRMAWMLVIACSTLVLSGCQKQASEPVSAAMMETRAFADAATGGGAATPRRNDSLAYEHEVAIELGKEQLPARLREIESACNADAASGCTILQVNAQSHGEIPSGSVRMRLAPAGVASMIDLASKDGKVLSRTTAAEDLAQPVADTERELALLSVHRDRLAEFMKSKELKIEQLITVSKELATVQAQIESLGSQRANLRRRIDTELLTITLSVPAVLHAYEQTPVTDSLKTFGSNLRLATAMVIDFISMLLPWLVVIVSGLILLRWFWRWITRWLVRRERRAEQGS